MALAQQENLFGAPPEPLKKPEPKAAMHPAAVQREATLDPALREIAAAVYEDCGYDFFPGDSAHWMTLFEEADKVDHELCSILMYLRGGGARLIPNPKFGYMIRPLVGRGAWSTQEEYDMERAALAPYREKLMALLKGLNEAMKKRR